MKSKFNILFEQVMNVILESRKDDIEFLKKHGKLNSLDSKSISPEMFEELVENENVIMR